jgi:hypothetical protein
MARGATYILRASLRPKLYRDVELASGRSLYDLAAAIVGSFGFDFDHAFGFYSKLSGRYHDSPHRYELFADLEDGGSDAESVQRTRIDAVFRRVGDKMLFLFDYGDGWRFTVELIGLGERAPNTRYPRVIASAGKAPAQYPDPGEDE